MWIYHHKVHLHAILDMCMFCLFDAIPITGKVCLPINLEFTRTECYLTFQPYNHPFNINSEAYACQEPYMSSCIKKHLFLTWLVVAKQNLQQTELPLSPFSACNVVKQIDPKYWSLVYPKTMVSFKTKFGVKIGIPCRNGFIPFKVRSGHLSSIPREDRIWGTRIPWSSLILKFSQLTPFWRKWWLI